MVGRAVGHEVEPIYGIPTQRYIDAYQGKGLQQLLDEIADMAKKRGGGQPSLLQDVIKKRRTEIDYLNGYVCDEGKRVGVRSCSQTTAARQVTSTSFRLGWRHAGRDCRPSLIMRCSKASFREKSLSKTGLRHHAGA